MKAKDAYRVHIIQGSQVQANLIHKYRQENRKPDGTRYTYEEAAKLWKHDMMNDLALAQ